ncbi:unnamed protein product [Peronospora belbahrii]|uniref:Uncharacterized protein n=1 Tax=Peronospora belbahrii TaxID=622444 RepID=A0AAU9LCB7_9STRA|nr:unnamed protein product [Peronospora belbahrii]
MDFKDLYLFVGPPMTRGPPSLPLLPLLLPPPVLPLALRPPVLPRPPSSCAKNLRKQRLRLKPPHYLKPSHRRLDNQVRPQVKAFVGPCEGLKRNACEVQMIMSNLELEYQTTKKQWLDYTATDTHSMHPPGNHQTIWTPVQDMCPQFLALDPVVGEYY